LLVPLGSKLGLTPPTVFASPHSPWERGDWFFSPLPPPPPSLFYVSPHRLPSKRVGFPHHYLFRGRKKGLPFFTCPLHPPSPQVFPVLFRFISSVFFYSSFRVFVGMCTPCEAPQLLVFDLLWIFTQKSRRNFSGGPHPCREFTSESLWGVALAFSLAPNPWDAVLFLMGVVGLCFRFSP